MIFYLIYHSQATAPMNDDDLLLLLDISRSWNKDHSLTGMLLYIQGEAGGSSKGRFIQVIEGTELEVRRIFDRIKTDARHHHVTILNEGKLKSRNFKDWRMGFESLTLGDVNSHLGYATFAKVFSEDFDPKKFNFALNFLLSFYDLRSTIC